MSTEQPTLSFIARQLERVLVEQADMHDQVTVQTAILSRLEGSMTTVVTELRALISRHDRLANRVRALEDAQPPPSV
jgi:hypothetical protein